MEDTAGPSIGPGPSAFPPFNPAAMAPSASGVISALPQPAMAYPNYPPPNFLPSQMPHPSFPLAPPPTQGAPPSIHPSRIAAMAAPENGAQPAGGVVRQREEDGNEAPDAKRPKIEKLPDGMYYPVRPFLSL